MKQKYVGTYYCGSEQIDLYARDGNGGEFYTTPEKKCLPRIKVGMNHREWKDVVSSLLHEVSEFCFTREGCRFDPTHDFSRDSSAYVFFANHPQFSNVCARSAEFLCYAMPDLCKTYKGWKK